MLLSWVLLLCGLWCFLVAARLCQRFLWLLLREPWCRLMGAARCRAMRLVRGLAPGRPLLQLPLMGEVRLWWFMLPARCRLRESTSWILEAG